MSATDPSTNAGPVTHDLCPLSELADESARRFDVAGHRLAVVRIGDSVYVLGDRCSHADYSLAEGEVDADAGTLECWKHGSAFSLADGEPNSLPAIKPVPVYEARIEGDRVVVVIP